MTSPGAGRTRACAISRRKPATDSIGLKFPKGSACVRKKKRKEIPLPRRVRGPTRAIHRRCPMRRRAGEAWRMERHHHRHAWEFRPTAAAHPLLSNCVRSTRRAGGGAAGEGRLPRATCRPRPFWRLPRPTLMSAGLEYVPCMSSVTRTRSRLAVSHAWSRQQAEWSQRLAESRRGQRIPSAAGFPPCMFP